MRQHATQLTLMCTPDNLPPTGTTSLRHFTFKEHVIMMAAGYFIAIVDATLLIKSLYLLKQVYSGGRREIKHLEVLWK